MICAGGLLLALRERPRNAALLSLPLFGLSYYLFYIAVIRYNYDRFNLPICVVLTLFGGKALSRAMASRPGWLLRPAAVAVFAFAFVSAASVDLVMLGDGRYRIERWMAQNMARDAAIRASPPWDYLPRLENRSPRLLTPNLEKFQADPKPDYIIYSAIHTRRYAPDTPEACSSLSSWTSRPDTSSSLSIKRISLGFP